MVALFTSIITFAIVEKLPVKIINRSNNPLPSYATEGSSGMDLRASIENEFTLQPLERKLVPTGLYIEIPEGYEVDEMPASSQFKLNENAGLFDYNINRNGTTIELNVKIRLSKAIYEPEEYQALRDFYKNIIKKEAEQIVFKKVK